MPGQKYFGIFSIKIVQEKYHPKYSVKSIHFTSFFAMNFFNYSGPVPFFCNDKNFVKVYYPKKLLLNHFAFSSLI